MNDMHGQLNSFTLELLHIMYAVAFDNVLIKPNNYEHHD